MRQRKQKNALPSWAQLFLLPAGKDLSKRLAFVIETAFPVPDQISKSNRTVIWYGLENLTIEEARITLREEIFTDILLQYIFLIAATGVIMGFVGLWFLRRRKHGKPIVKPGKTTSEIVNDDKPEHLNILNAYTYLNKLNIIRCQQ